MAPGARCRICGETVVEFLDFGTQPLSDAFRDPADTTDEFTYRLAVGVCGECGMVQLTEEVPREEMFHEDYPYLSRGSAVMRRHFQELADDSSPRNCPERNRSSSNSVATTAPC